MKAVIFAGGMGTRISEETITKPKPMIEIGGKPLLWHIMKMYSQHGINDFIICLGYRGYMIKEFFFNYHRHLSDMSINLKSGEVTILDNHVNEDWTVSLLDTGADTMTGGRLKRIAKHLGDETFCLTYGDGLSDINITKEVEFHRKHGKLATVAAVEPPGRFGVLKVNNQNIVTSFEEKPSDEFGWINGGFFVLEPGAIEYIDGDSTSWENEPLSNIVKDGQLASFIHKGFWKPCDTLRDKRQLDSLWEKGVAPWCTWNVNTK